MKTDVRKSFLGGIALAGLTLAGCGGAEESAPGVVSDESEPVGDLLAAAIDSPMRSEAERSRDKWRHPYETLGFFGVEPEMTVVEIWPGGGWYTGILGPYLKSGGGTLILASVDPETSDYTRANHARLTALTDDAARFGRVEFAIFAPGKEPSSTLAPGAADAVVTFRNLHNWLGGDAAEDAFATMFAALKPGGVLGFVEHRADPTAEDGKSHGGYVTERTAIDLAEKAGFVLEARSDINANSADDRDHPFGVWTLPPVSRTAPAPGLPAEVDAEEYLAIGESDRMTLRFRKPGGAEPDEQSDGATEMATGEE
ncbi:MAG: hypothetical protein GC152_10615 [Alphaproteobacteria bacterium]|nr:hypothetical protein [Alphaproteobacteria bacterium]